MATVKKTIKKAQTGRKVPDTKTVGEDLSISNAVRRLAKNPKDPDNVINQAMRLNPVTQLARAGAEGFTRIGAALGNKNMKKEIATRDSTYKAQKKELQKKKTGGMLKRADGSYSKRGLWDNIRANKGSGKKPTAAMLKQEKKIKAKTKK
jgi:hypothetical protein